MPTRKVVIENNKVKILPCPEDLEKLSISPYNRIYVGIRANTDELYILHRSHGEDDNYRWYSLWSSDAWTSVGTRGKLISEFKTIESALEVALGENWIIRQLNYDFFKQLISDMKTNIL